MVKEVLYYGVVWWIVIFIDDFWTCTHAVISAESSRCYNPFVPVQVTKFHKQFVSRTANVSHRSASSVHYARSVLLVFAFTFVVFIFAVMPCFVRNLTKRSQRFVLLFVLIISVNDQDRLFPTTSCYEEIRSWNSNSFDWDPQTEISWWPRTPKRHSWGNI